MEAMEPEALKVEPVESVEAMDPAAAAREAAPPVEPVAREAVKVEPVEAVEAQAVKAPLAGAGQCSKRSCKMRTRSSQPPRPMSWRSAHSD